MHLLPNLSLICRIRKKDTGYRIRKNKEDRDKIKDNRISINFKWCTTRKWGSKEKV